MGRAKATHEQPAPPAPWAADAPAAPAAPAADTGLRDALAGMGAQVAKLTARITALEAMLAPPPEPVGNPIGYRVEADALVNVGNGLRTRLVQGKVLALGAYGGPAGIEALRACGVQLSPVYADTEDSHG
jgi:hypothetical protein